MARGHPRISACRCADAHSCRATMPPDTATCARMPGSSMSTAPRARRPRLFNRPPKPLLCTEIHPPHLTRVSIGAAFDVPLDHCVVQNCFARPCRVT